jgi:hypothetical protein
LSGADAGTEIPFFVSGYVATEKGANGHLLFSVSDQSWIVDFSESSDNDFVQQFNYKVGSASELRITIFLLADRDSASDAGVSLNVLSIDTDVSKHQSAPISDC